MSYDGWIEYNGVELVNLSRTAQLSNSLGLDLVWTSAESVQWIEDELSGSDETYADITQAPWYDPGYPASAEFAGIVSLSMQGLDDSSLTSSPVEYVGDGGNSGKPRNSTQSIVANVGLVGLTDRGVDYGLRWMNKILRDSGSQQFCSGADLRYFRAEGGNGVEVEKTHRRDVRVTRGSSVTRKSTKDCSSVWIVTFTFTAADPYEYGEEVAQITSLGGEAATGPNIVSSGSTVLVNQSCPKFDYTPIYDPLFPALVPSPTAPNFLPDGWNISDGMTFDRFWTRLNPADPVDLNMVPVITLTSDTAARMVRVSIWPSDSAIDDQCDPLFSTVVSYLPPTLQFVIDGEQKVAYAWDGVSPVVRRTDSLVYSPDANPVQWTSFNDPVGLMVTLDIFSDSSGFEGDGDVRLAMSLVAKSD